MNHRKARSTDLNLLVTLDALLETHNVSRAADKLGLSQPAVSHALNRLRGVFDDPILVRSGREMVPTPRAESLRPEIQGILSEIDGLFVAGEGANPSETARTFVIASNGFAAQLLIPEISLALGREAPNADLHLIPTGHHDLRTLLSSRDVDMCLLSETIRHLPETLMMRSLYRDPFVVNVRAGHPFEDTVSMVDFSDASHILVSPRGDRVGAVDAMLAEHDLQRRIALTLTNFIVVPEVLRRTDYVITTPISISRMLQGQAGIRQLALPEALRVDSGALIALWHERVHRDPLNQWFRTLVFEASKRALSQISM